MENVKEYKVIIQDDVYIIQILSPGADVSKPFTILLTKEGSSQPEYETTMPFSVALGILRRYGVKPIDWLMEDVIYYLNNREEYLELKQRFRRDVQGTSE